MEEVATAAGRESREEYSNVPSKTHTLAIYENDEFMPLFCTESLKKPLDGSQVSLKYTSLEPRTE